MNITHVSICPTDASEAAGRPALTPELLAATGARYSRNNEGLDSIVARIDPTKRDASVDSIFKMLDYGHQSIADMVPVAIFMDDISIWLAYYIWSQSPQAGGQESSTRYIKITPESLIDAEKLGIAPELRDEWSKAMAEAFKHYEAAEGAWDALAVDNPSLMRIPSAMLADDSPKAQKQVARMKRNYAFDRARYFLPAAAKTNVMMVMSARAWAQLCTRLCSELLPEARELGEAIREELKLVAPHLLRHSGATKDCEDGIRAFFDDRVAIAGKTMPDANDAAADTAHLEIMLPQGVEEADLEKALAYHSNRYAWQGAAAQRTGVRFSWDAVTLAEIRDLNRHRTGSKYSSLVPRGFYAAQEEIPAGKTLDAVEEGALFGRILTKKAHELLKAGDPTYVYWTLLGTQFDFEHITTADKFIYEAELRTGTGSHYKYAKHFHDALALWFKRFPETRKYIAEGTAEPE